MKNDLDLEKDIQDAFKWDPLLKTAKITVQSHDGLVSLSGVVQSYLIKLQAENITKSIVGVKAIIEHITVKTASVSEDTDEEVADQVLHHLKLNWLPLDCIDIKVENGHVTLDGHVKYNFQKEDAKKSVGNVKGVKIFTNNLKMVTETPVQLEKLSIEQALLRYSATYDQNIRVSADGNLVSLKGTVKSLYQKEEAEKIAWNGPGVLAVNNELLIE
ncbi:BON domain-containing protein [Pedobacter arcticus]|uniref:BON domain-containing protein n=1 Tax=Pedobacter arcticus TaxID=752140 RepID=UPI0002E3F566|nr:BON domain-containing protein [Pedobacter arcticus]